VLKSSEEAIAMAEWKRLTIPDGGGTTWVNLDRIAYIDEVKNGVLGTFTRLHFDDDFYLQVKEAATEITGKQ
jgi:hypothetical protein